MNSLQNLSAFVNTVLSISCVDFYMPIICFCVLLRTPVIIYFIHFQAFHLSLHILMLKICCVPLGGVIMLALVPHKHQCTSLNTEPCNDSPLASDTQNARDPATCHTLSCSCRLPTVFAQGARDPSAIRACPTHTESRSVLAPATYMCSALAACAWEPD